MSHDILQPIPQGGYGAYDEENRKIQGIADELQRLCRIHEEEFGDSQTNGGSLEIEQRISERYAKTHNLWIPIDYMFDLGVPGPSGNENDTTFSFIIMLQHPFLDNCKTDNFFCRYESIDSLYDISACSTVIFSCVCKKD